MTRWDRTTRCRAKGLWAGRPRYADAQPDPVREPWVRAAPRPWSVHKPVVKLRRAKTTDERSGLKPYWGKPAVRNFRGGGGNVVHGLVTICHAARKGGYDGSHWPTHRRDSSPLDRHRLGTGISRTVTRIEAALPRPGLLSLWPSAFCRGRLAIARTARLCERRTPLRWGLAL